MKSVQLRGWQREAFALYLQQIESVSNCNSNSNAARQSPTQFVAPNKRYALWEATPGAGKTTAALEVIKHQLQTGRAKFALIVVPTSHLRVQWAHAAKKAGIQLDSAFTGARTLLTSDFNGAVVTYQQFGNRGKVFRDLAAQSVVILDEVHHAGDGLTWGNAVRATLDRARFILCLSGTAFRSDNNAIPFVHYDKDGMSAPDYIYPYAQAVADRVCRPAAVFTYGGEVAWSENDKVMQVSFADSLDGIASARRLKAALDPESGWVQPMLQDAHEMLKHVRLTNPKAGGLLVCADQTHARSMAKLIALVSGEKPTIVLSDDSGASKKIRQFSESESMWLVACNMVSEGVDIPRLQVGVYATTIKTKMYFRQFLGRIVRRQSHIAGAQIAYVYLPADPFLHHLAEEIETETRHILGQQDEFDIDDDLRDRKRADPDAAPVWSPLQSTNSGVDAIIVNGNQLALFGGMALASDVQQVIYNEVETHLEQNRTRSETKAYLATEIKKLVGSLHRKALRPHSAIHSALNKLQKVSSQTHCTEQQLKERVTLLEKLLSEHARGIPLQRVLF